MIVYFGVRGIVTAALAALAIASPAVAATGVKNQGCGAGQLVLSVRYHVQNDVDTGVKGNNWAFDDYVRTVRVWRKGAARFCAASTYTGTFDTIAGPSPGGRATIPAGIRGAVRGFSTTTFRGAFSPASQPTRGDLGTKDFACVSTDRKGECARTYDWLSAYFTSTDGFKSFRYVRYSFTYKATEGGRGTWRDFMSGGKIRSQGDIVPKKPKKK
jgi:hypothetical protein